MVSHHVFPLFTTMSACLQLDKCPSGKQLEEEPKSGTMRGVGPRGFGTHYKQKDHRFGGLQIQFRPFSGSSAISRIAARALVRVGVSGYARLGAHMFRHTAASDMVNRGASFKEVADVLGHQSLQTTGIYAKLDLPTLSEVALPWIGEAQ